MYVSTEGEFTLSNKSIIFKNYNNKTSMIIEGESVEILSKIVPLFTGTTHIKTIKNYINNIFPDINIKSIEQLLLDLEKNNLINILDNPSSTLCFITENIPIEQLKKIYNVDGIKDISNFSKIEELKNQKGILVAIDYDNNIQFFQKVSDYANKNSLAWLRIAINEPFIYIGPIFTPDGGPCFGCFLERLQVNNNLNVENKNIIPTYGKIDDIIPGFSLRQIMKLVKGNNPCESFGREIIINANSLKTSSYLVLALPNCQTCKNKKGYYNNV